jgi:deazaflavin-dependent oxidoreductase (nitroreductase family)
MADEAKLPPKKVIRFFTSLNVLMYRLSGGRLMNRLEGAPICLVTMTGRKSGKRKTIALMYTPHGQDVLLVASLGGAPANPVWYYNLKADPQVEIQAGSVRRRMLAREASPEEKRILWPVVVANYRSFDAYQKRTTRDIPLFVCSPATA